MKFSVFTKTLQVVGKHFISTFHISILMSFQLHTQIPLSLKIIPSNIICLPTCRAEKSSLNVVIIFCVNLCHTLIQCQPAKITKMLFALKKRRPDQPTLFWCIKYGCSAHKCMYVCVYKPEQIKSVSIISMLVAQRCCL